MENKQHEEPAEPIEGALPFKVPLGLNGPPEPRKRTPNVLPLIMPDDAAWKKRVEELALKAGFKSIVGPDDAAAWNAALFDNSGLSIQRLNGEGKALEPGPFAQVSATPRLHNISLNHLTDEQAVEAVSKALAKLRPTRKR